MMDKDSIVNVLKLLNSTQTNPAIRQDIDTNPAIRQNIDANPAFCRNADPTPPILSQINVTLPKTTIEESNNIQQYIPEVKNNAPPTVEANNTQPKTAASMTIEERMLLLDRLAQEKLEGGNSVKTPAKRSALGNNTQRNEEKRETAKEKMEKMKATLLEKKSKYGYEEKEFNDEQERRKYEVDFKNVGGIFNAANYIPEQKVNEDYRNMEHKHHINPGEEDDKTRKETQSIFARIYKASEIFQIRDLLAERYRTTPADISFMYDTDLQKLFFYLQTKDPETGAIEKCGRLIKESACEGIEHDANETTYKQKAVVVNSAAPFQTNKPNFPLTNRTAAPASTNAGVKRITAANGDDYAVRSRRSLLSALK